MRSETPAAAEWPVSGLEAVPDCPLCGAKQRTLAHAGLKDYCFECAPGVWSMFQCDQCGSGYLDPRPNQQTIGLAYSRYYTHQAFDASLKGLRGLWLALRDDYVKAAFGVNVARALWPGRWLFQLFPITRQGVDASLARNLVRPTEATFRLLDVGCGNGNFLKFARKAGWQVRGLDLDPVAVAAARSKGLDVLLGTIDILDGESECYDRITLSHVLEHVYDPWDVLARCFRLLKPGGVLWLEAPNMQSNGRIAFDVYWRGLEPPRHLHLFSRKCLKDKIGEIGFSEIQDRFSSFATQAMWKESRQIMVKAGVGKRLRHTFVGQLIAEVKALFSVNSREFITLVCVKKNEKK